MEGEQPVGVAGGWALGVAATEVEVVLGEVVWAMDNVEMARVAEVGRVPDFVGMSVSVSGVAPGEGLRLPGASDM